MSNAKATAAVAPAPVGGEEKRGRRPSSHDVIMAETFPSKAHLLVEHCDENRPDVACWNDDGSAFVVRDVKELSSAFLPQYFRHSNFQSFVRQLNLYGFRSFKSGEGKVTFCHDRFKKGRRDILGDIKRGKNGKKKKKNGTASDAGDHGHEEEEKKEGGPSDVAPMSSDSSLHGLFDSMEDRLKEAICGQMRIEMHGLSVKLDLLLSVLANDPAATTTALLPAEGKGPSHQNDDYALLSHLKSKRMRHNLCRHDSGDGNGTFSDNSVASVSDHSSSGSASRTTTMSAPSREQYSALDNHRVPPTIYEEDRAAAYNSHQRQQRYGVLGAGHGSDGSDGSIRLERQDGGATAGPNDEVGGVTCANQRVSPEPNNKKDGEGMEVDVNVGGGSRDPSAAAAAARSGNYANAEEHLEQQGGGDEDEEEETDDFKRFIDVMLDAEDEEAPTEDDCDEQRRRRLRRIHPVPEQELESRVVDSSLLLRGATQDGTGALSSMYGGVGVGLASASASAAALGGQPGAEELYRQQQQQAAMQSQLQRAATGAAFYSMDGHSGYPSAAQLHSVAAASAETATAPDFVHQQADRAATKDCPAPVEGVQEGQEETPDVTAVTVEVKPPTPDDDGEDVDEEAGHVVVAAAESRAGAVGDEDQDQDHEGSLVRATAVEVVPSDDESSHDRRHKRLHRRRCKILTLLVVILVLIAFIVWPLLVFRRRPPPKKKKNDGASAANDDGGRGKWRDDTYEPSKTPRPTKRPPRGDSGDSGEENWSDATNSTDDGEGESHGHGDDHGDGHGGGGNQYGKVSGGGGNGGGGRGGGGGNRNRGGWDEGNEGQEGNEDDAGQGGSEGDATEESTSTTKASQGDEDEAANDTAKDNGGGSAMPEKYGLFSPRPRRSPPVVGGASARSAQILINIDGQTCECQGGYTGGDDNF